VTGKTQIQKNIGILEIFTTLNGNTQIQKNIGILTSGCQNLKQCWETASALRYSMNT
jgi:hypothetical protein